MSMGSNFTNQGGKRESHGSGLAGGRWREREQKLNTRAAWGEGVSGGKAE